jgi:hypothetical protein
MEIESVEMVGGSRALIGRLLPWLIAGLARMYYGRRRADHELFIFPQRMLKEERGSVCVSWPLLCS